MESILTQPIDSFIGVIDNMVYQAILSEGYIFTRDCPDLKDFIKALRKDNAGADHIFDDAVDAMVTTVDIVELYHRFNRFDDYNISAINEVVSIWKQ